MILKSDLLTAYQMQQPRKSTEKNKSNGEKTDQTNGENSFVQVISGIRSCGKSTLVRFFMSKYTEIAYFNFEDSRVLSFAFSDFSKLDKIIPDHTEAYFFSEIQNVPQWEIYIQHLHEYGKKIYISGSTASVLSKDLKTRLNEKHLNTELFPFSYSEFLQFKKIVNSEVAFQKYLTMGGFPEFLKTNKVEILQNLFKEIVFKDIAIKHSIRNTKSLIDIALYLLSNIGKEITFNGLKKTFEVGSANTIMGYLNWFEDAYLLFFLQKFSWSTKSIAINPRKVYAIDNALINANSLSFSRDKERMLENAVYIYLRSNGIKMYYFKEKKECDFVLLNQEKCTMAIQACYDFHSENEDREIDGLLEAMNFFDLQEGTIINKNQKKTFIIGDKKINLIPAFEFFATALSF